MAYAISTIQIAPATMGYDLDGACIGGTCVDNRASALSPILNDPISQAHLNGYGRTLIEISGNDAPFGDDPRATFRTYEALDWTTPINTSDDFSGNGRFAVTSRSTLGEPPRARWRVPAVIEDGAIRSAGVGTLAFTLPVISAPQVMTLEVPTFEAMRVSQFDARLTLLLGGAIPTRELAMVLNPRRTEETPEQTVLDFLASRGVQPDIDLDGDGLETLTFDPATARVGECYDGCSEQCPQQLAIAPEDIARPWTCVFTDSLRDGYSITLVLAASPAIIGGIR
jgi:hypothetical protein